MLKDGGSFKVDARRNGTHPYTSMQLAARAGEEIFEALKPRGVHVDLHRPDLVVYVEVRDRRAYVFSEYLDGPGGLPMGSQGKVVAVIERRRDALAAWMMMKRGCRVLLLGDDAEALSILTRWDPEPRRMQRGPGKRGPQQQGLGRGRGLGPGRGGVSSDHGCGRAGIPPSRRDVKRRNRKAFGRDFFVGAVRLLYIVVVSAHRGSSLLRSLALPAQSASLATGGGLAAVYPALVGVVAQPVQVLVGHDRGVVLVHHDDLEPYVLTILAHPVGVEDLHVGEALGRPLLGDPLDALAHGDLLHTLALGAASLIPKALVQPALSDAAADDDYSLPDRYDASDLVSREWWTTPPRYRDCSWSV